MVEFDEKAIVAATYVKARVKVELEIDLAGTWRSDATLANIDYSARRMALEIIHGTKFNAGGTGIRIVGDPVVDVITHRKEK